MKRFSMSDIKIRQDIDQKLAHKYDSPNDETPDDEVGYYVLDDSKQSSIDCSNTKVYLIDEYDKMIEITPTGLKKTFMNLKDYMEDDK